MSTTIQELATQAIALSAADRARLVDLLLASLPDEEDADVDTAWDHEIERRVAAIQSGQAQLIGATDVHAQARKLYRR